jgi:hypothetical protein
LGIAVAVFGQFNDFRYSDVSLSERNSPILLLAILANVFVQLDLFYQMFLASLVHIRIFSLRWIENMMMVAALFFGVAGTASVMIGLIALLFSLFPTRFKQLVYAGGGGVSTARILKFAALSCAFVVVFFLAWNVGEGIKAASDTGLSIEAVVENMPEIAGNLDLDFAKFFLYTIIERISVHYYSFLMTENLPKNELLHNEPSAFAYPFRSFLFRSNFLFGQAFDVERPDTTTVAQLNYRNLTSLKDFNPREGSAPGLLASFNYAFPFPLNILFCALYLVWVSKVIDVITSANSDKSLSIFGAFLVYLFIDIFFQTPNDFLVVVDNAIFYLAIILGIYFKKKSEPDYVAHALT